MRKSLILLTTLTLAAALSSCGGAGQGALTPPGGGTGGGNGGNGGGGNGGSAIPAELQGQWDYGYVSPIEYYDPSSGQYAEQSGTSEILKLKANGDYERVGIIVVSGNSCTSKLLLNQKGSVRLTDKTLTLVPRESYSKGYICNPGKTYESRELKNAEFTWHLENSGDQAVLLLGDPTGKLRDSRYNRPRGTGGGGGGGTTDPQPREGSISGTVSAPQGHSLVGAVIYACPMGANSKPDCEGEGENLKFIRLVSEASETSFEIEGLANKRYAVFAWQDSNRSGSQDQGDWFDVNRLQDDDPVTVTAPAANVRVELGQWE